MLFKRAIAFVIDILVVSLVIAALPIANASIKNFVPTLGIYFYFLVIEKLWSTTLGKKLMGLKTISFMSPSLSWRQSSLKSIIKLAPDLFVLLYLGSKLFTKAPWYETMTQAKTASQKDKEGIQNDVQINRNSNDFWGSFRFQALLIVFYLILYLSLTLCFKVFVGDTRYVTTKGMQPYLEQGDRFLAVNTLNLDRDYKRGQVILFFPPKKYANFSPFEGEITASDIILKSHLLSLFFTKKPDVWVFRIIGLPGEEVEIKAMEGVFVNGNKIDTEYSQLYKTVEKELPKTKIPKNSYFLLGDNINEAYDSKYYGPVTVDRFTGVPKLFYMKNGKLVFEWIN